MDSTGEGIAGIGAVIAAILSWQVNASIGWAIVHACCGWFYVFYRVLF